MKNVCNEMRERFADSLGRILDPTERDEIERHCAECEACRTYRERLFMDDSKLAEFAAPAGESIRRVREGAIDKLRAVGSSEAPESATERARTRGPRASTVLARIPRIAAFAAAAAAVIITLLAIDFLRGTRNGAVPAFAAVQEKMQQVDKVVYRQQTWNLGQWTTREEGRANPHRFRKDFGDSIFVTDIHRGGIDMLLLYPAERRAVISRTEYPPEQDDQFDRFDQRVPKQVDFLATWYKAKDFVFVRKERLDGKNTAVYEKYPNAKNKKATRMTAWVDLETDLPVRFEMASPRPDPNSGYHYGLRLSDFQAEDSKTARWVYLKEGDPVVILDNFRWGASVDTSYFSTVPPAGYSVETRLRDDMVIAHYGRGFGNYTYGPDTCKTEGRAASEIISGHLSTWLSLAGNVFPDEIEDLGDSTKVNKLLIAKYRRGGDPADEFRAALRTWEDFEGFGADFGHRMREHRHIDIHYTGKGAVLGDSKRIVLWLEDLNAPPCPGREGNGPYYILYGDLRIAAGKTPPSMEN